MNSQATYESIVTQHKVTYVISYTFELDHQQLTFHLTHDPDNLSNPYDVQFKSVYDFFEEHDDDFDPDCLQSIIGIDTYPRGKHSGVVVRLDETEISFKTTVSPKPLCFILKRVLHGH